MSGDGSPLARAVAAELSKLRSLPAARWALLGTIAASLGLATAVAASAPAAGVDAMRIVASIMPFLQVGPILLGVLAASSEYAGRQISTSLIVMPVRIRLLAAKAAAFLAVAAAMSSVAVGAGAAAAWAVFEARGDGVADDGARGLALPPLAGAVLYLLLMGLLALAAAVLLRSFVPPFAAVLVLVLVVSPLAAAATEHARWLPDRAGAALYDPAAPNPWAGLAALLAWVVATGAIAIAAFRRRDA